MQTCLKRLRKEAQNLEKESQSDDFVRLQINPDNMRDWTAIITGPEESFYYNYQFIVSIEVLEQYPLVPPKMTFITKIFHPNVHFDTGEICLDILKKEWSPAWTIQSACRAIVALLAAPAPDRYYKLCSMLRWTFAVIIMNNVYLIVYSPLNCDAGNMLRAGDQRAFKAMATLYCVEFATMKTVVK